LRYLQLLIPVKADIAKIEKEPESLTLIKTTADRWTEYCMNGTNIMRIILFLSILLITDRENAFSQSIKTDFNNALSRLESFRRNRPVENIYIHFDKPYYAAGDTIYFKTYVTLNEFHKPTPLSEVVHVDLITPQSRILKSIKLKLNQGTAFADFELPDSVPAGIYRIRAYTRWMLNEGSGSFLNQSIVVGSSRKSSGQADIAASHLGSDKPYIRFFPEGGELLTEVESKVAFKAIGNNGLGMKVKGMVVDNDGKEITRFQSVHLGMGFFYLKPEEGKSYSAKLTFGDGSNATVDLPKGNPNGMVMSADNESPDTTIINVLTTKDYLKEHQNEEITLLIYSSGVPSMAQAKLSSENIDFAIDKKRLYSGIMRITLFSSQLEPMSERLVFIMNKDQINLQAKGEKPVYSKREKVEISLNAKDQEKNPVQGNFSVSVVNEDIIKLDENKESTIYSNLLLTSGLNGYVEQPNYYFVKSGDEVAANLDILMLTQGYRHFLWKQVLMDSLVPLQYKAERFLQLQGFVRSSSGKPVKNEKVTLSDPTGQGPELKEITDSAGRFIFKNLEFSDTVHFTITSAKINSRIIISSFPSPILDEENTPELSTDADSVMDAYLKIKATEKEFNTTKTLKSLKAVTVTANKRNIFYYTESLAGAGHADQVFHGNELKSGGSLTDQLMGRLRGIIFFSGIPVLSMNASGNGINPPNPMMVLVDGIELNPPDVNSINSNEIETIEVLKSGNASMYGMSGGGGILVITTKRPREIEVDNSSDSNAMQVSVMGFYKAREFYSPKYEVKDTSNTGQDLRTTVFWKPDLITNNDGNASFNFYNADIKGVYKVVVEGIDENGNIGRQVYRYRVQ
jgi:TonB-dependent Receptor Plug Domain